MKQEEFNEANLMKEDFIPLVGNLDKGDVFEKDFIDILKMVSPGTSLRIALDDLLRAKMGALIVFENNLTSPLIEGGFEINCKFSSQKLVELAKMDGAIILSNDGKNILRANTMVYPSIEVSTKETGTRHKSAERAARQAKTLVIAVSERKNKISLFYCNECYQLESSSEVMRRVSETLQVLEKQREIYDDVLDNLNMRELEKVATIKDVCLVLQRAEIIKRVADIIKGYLIELGKEGNIFNMRLKELLGMVSKEENLILRDYFVSNPLKFLEVLEKLDFEFLLDPMNISKIIFGEEHDRNISPKGIRILSKTNLIDRYVDLLVGNFENLNEILSAKNKELLSIFESEAIIAFFQEEIYNLRQKLISGRKI